MTATPRLATTPDRTSPPFADPFIKHGVYLRGWSPTTVRTYRQGLAAFGVVLQDRPASKAALQDFIVTMRQRGLTPGGINMYARTINSYLAWLHEEGHAPERLRIKLLPNPAKPYQTLSDLDIRRVVVHAPKGWAQTRVWTLAMLLLDTGLRITEALTLQREDVDLDAMAIRVLGKGQRVRLVPISGQGRKALFRWMSRSEGRLLLGTRRGRQWSARNAHRNLIALCRTLGIVGPRVNPHAFRHCFAVNYVRNGGDIYR